MSGLKAEDRCWRFTPAYRDLTAWQPGKACFACPDRILCREDVAAILFVLLFKPGGNIDVVTMDGEGQPVFGANRTNNDIAGIDAASGFKFSTMTEYGFSTDACDIQCCSDRI